MKLWKWLAIPVAVWIVATLAFGAWARTHKPRGQMVPVATERRLHVVCEGPRSGPPTVWMEAGAFSGASDFGAVQRKLAAKGFRSCAYDRAGQGYSDAADGVRDADAILADLEQAMAAVGEPEPVVLVGHSMGGLYVRRFAIAHPDRIAGLVLVEAATPAMFDQAGVRRFREYFRWLGRAGAAAGATGLANLSFFRSDRIGLPADVWEEKRRGLLSWRQTSTSAREIEAWEAAGRQAGAAPLRPQWPVAVITAGTRPPVSGWEEARRAPATASQAGAYRNVPDASHTSILGERHADAVVDGVLHVIAAHPPDMSSF